MVRKFCLTALLLPLVTAGFSLAATPVHHRIHRVVHHSDGIGIAVDEARLVSFTKPVKTVFVGNPTIADVSLVDERHAFVLGKTMGLTNVIALDSDGNQIDNRSVIVTNTFAAVTLDRGPGAQFNYTCTLAHCESAPRPGDVKQYLDDTENATKEHEDEAGKNATSSSGTTQSPSS